MKKRFVLFAFVLLMLALGGCNLSSFSGASVSKSLTNSRWKITAKTLNGYASRSISPTADNMSAVHVENTNSDGTVSLTITQGETEKTFDITDGFNGNPDLSGFDPGKAKMRLDVKKAEDIKILVKWK